MRFPLEMTVRTGAYIARNKLSPNPAWQCDPEPTPFPVLTGKQSKGNSHRNRHPLHKRRFPIVLMLEPLHACNLTCTGCGRIREYEDSITERLSLDQCLAAIDECGAPIVSICGGEPMMYPEIGPLVTQTLERKKHIYLCTNGMFLPRRIGDFRPDKRFFFNVHLDGMKKTHDMAVEREGVFEEAVEGIRVAKKAGFMVCTNTTVYRETDMAEIEELFGYLEQFGVDGHMLSPAYPYSAVETDEIFLTREEVHEKFAGIDRLFKRFNLNSSPTYLKFLKGEKDLPCTAWGNPTYNVAGWKGPCYLITDDHWQSFDQLMSQTPWDNYGRGADDRCEHCMVHCGYEPTAALGVNSTLGDSLRMAAWALAS